MSCKGDTRIRCFIPPESITEAYLLYIFTGISMCVYVCVCVFICKGHLCILYIGIPTEFNCMLASDRPWPVNVKKKSTYAMHNIFIQSYVHFTQVFLGESTGTGWVRTA